MILFLPNIMDTKISVVKHYSTRLRICLLICFYEVLITLLMYVKSVKMTIILKQIVDMI